MMHAHRPASPQLAERTPRLLAAFPGVPDLTKDALTHAQSHIRLPASNLVRSSTGLSASQRDPRLALAHAARRYASSPVAASPRVRLGLAPTPRARQQPPSLLALDGQQRLAAMPTAAQSLSARSRPPTRTRTSCSIPPRHSARVALPTSIGPTAHTLHIAQRSDSELSAVAIARRGAPGGATSHRGVQPARRSKSSSPPRVERFALSATMPPMRSMPLALALSADAPSAVELPALSASAAGKLGRSLSLLALNRVPRVEAREAARLEHDASALSALSLLTDRPAWATSASEIRLIERIGVGAFGEVFRAEWRGRQVAVKRLHADGGSAGAARERGKERALAFVAEMRLMAALHHAHIVEFLAGCLEQGALCMAHELCAHELHALLHGRAVLHGSLQLPLAVQLKWAREIALGVAYLHAQQPPIAHRDLKPANILLTASWVAKVSDFGAARVRSSAHIETARIGTCRWMAPEVLRQRPHDERADAFSFGIVLYELASRRLPYDEVAQQQVEVAIITGRQPPPGYARAFDQLAPAPPASVREAMVALAESCLEADFTRRPRFHQVESELQSAQNLLLRDAHANAWLAPADPPGDGPVDDAETVVPPHAQHALATRTGAACDATDFRSVAERQLQRLLAMSARLLAADAHRLDVERAASRTSAVGSHVDSDTDSDADSSSKSSVPSP
ncbi:hypothetical protein KFE25_007429 [Diacronema lutheri]|uniref:Protein kinase domain-containing protein n=1 Tax=Diacronema lutheri TaxID=2081491 RepID=A0A8J5XHC1_DIALT|nr:hypothetical protein KFE25_007429 [Diacronema lutheri]